MGSNVQSTKKQQTRTFLSKSLSRAMGPTTVYYCKVCNFSGNSKEVLLLHLQHKHKIISDTNLKMKSNTGEPVTKRLTNMKRIVILRQPTQISSQTLAIQLSKKEVSSQRQFF